MNSPVDRLHQETVAPALLWLHGDDEGNVIRWISGDPAATELVRGVFYPAETIRNESTGIDLVTEDDLEIAGTQTAAENDKWQIDGVVYHVLAVSPIVGGIKEVRLKRVDQKVRRHKRDII